jgi:hypothetical protein
MMGIKKEHDVDILSSTSAKYQQTLPYFNTLQVRLSFVPDFHRLPSSPSLPFSASLPFLLYGHQGLAQC